MGVKLQSALSLLRKRKAWGGVITKSFSKGIIFKFWKTMGKQPTEVLKESRGLVKEEEEIFDEDPILEEEYNPF